MWKRVVAPTILVSILWVAVSFLTSYHLQQIYESHSRTLSEDVPTIEAAWAMRRDIWKIQATVLEQPRDQFRAAETRIRDSFRGFEFSLAEVEKPGLTDLEQPLVKKIREQFNAYRSHILKLLEEGGQPDVDKTSMMASGVADTARQLLQVNQEFIRQQTAEDHKLRSTIRMYRIAFMIGGPLVGLLFGLLVARGLRRSLSRIRVTLKGATSTLGSELGSVAVTTPDDLPALQRQAEVVAERIRQVVEELDEARRKLVQSERLAAVGELAAGVAHEIRNPLTSVKLLIQAAAQRQQHSALSAKQFEVVLGEILRMEQTIQGLLDFARPPRLRRVCHDVRQPVQRALNLVLARAEQQHVDIAEQFCNEPVMIDGDPEQLHTVFVNLAINSVEAMPRGGTLRVTIESSDRECRIIFADTGEGISPEVLPRLFEPFVTSKDRGTGLGLAISRRVAIEHGGMLTAANRDGAGAELTVTLPLAVGTTSDNRGQSEDAAGNEAGLPEPAAVKP